MFKPGDKVKLINNQAMAAQIGATATVKAVNKYCLDVIWDDNNLRAHPQHPNAKQMHGEYASIIFESAIDYLQITREIVGSR